MKKEKLAAIHALKGAIEKAFRHEDTLCDSQGDLPYRSLALCLVLYGSIAEFWEMSGYPIIFGDAYIDTTGTYTGRGVSVGKLCKA